MHIKNKENKQKNPARNQNLSKIVKEKKICEFIILIKKKHLGFGGWSYSSVVESAPSWPEALSSSPASRGGRAGKMLGRGLVNQVSVLKTDTLKELRKLHCVPDGPPDDIANSQIN